MNKLLKLGAAVLSAAILITSFACSSKSSDNKSSDNKSDGNKGSAKRVVMITDIGGVNDGSFNQSAWNGLQALQEEMGKDKLVIHCIESKSDKDYEKNVASAEDMGANLIVCVGFNLKNAVFDAAMKNPSQQYAIIDETCDAYKDYKEQHPGVEKADNLAGVTFKAEQSAFVCGYIAAAFTESNVIGFVGGMDMQVIHQFGYAYMAGADYGSKLLHKKVTVKDKWDAGFADEGKAKMIAQTMINSDGADILFHAAGQSGIGVIQAAKEAKKFAIGVDRDQYGLGREDKNKEDSPDKVVISSAVKNVGKAMQIITKKALFDGEDIGGKNHSFGLAEGCVGIPEKAHHHVIGDEIYNRALEIQDLIKEGKIVPPTTKEAYEKWKSGLNNA